MSVKPGSHLGPYEVLALLGAGGMGEVYRARDTRLGRDVAIKVLPAAFSADADRLRRFEQEARAAGQLNHPNITTVFDVGEHDGSPYVVQELLEGETLRSVMAGRRLAHRRAVDLAVQIAQGLAAAHEKGIVHRDLKPENLFVMRDGRLKILDFGLAKLLYADAERQADRPTARGTTESGLVMGTLAYMSPEQVRGRSVDPRSDIFSFGAVLYEMVSGRRAFRGDTAADTISAILREDPPELSAAVPQVPSGLEGIIRHCLEKDPERRFQSAHDLAFDLETVSGVSAGAPTASLVGRPGARRIPLVAVAAVGLALLIAGVLAGYQWSSARAARGAPELMTRRRLTFRRGVVLAARLTANGQDVVYSASWDGHPTQIYFTHVGSPESRSLGIENASLLSVSSSGELAILLKRSHLFGPGASGTLARVPLAGGAPRQIAENVTSADWTPDGNDLAVVRDLGSRTVIEFPLGKPVYSCASTLSSVRVSPDGKRVAVIETDGVNFWIDVVGAGGKEATLARGFIGVFGLAWAPSGGEIWFSAVDRSPAFGIFAVNLAGAVRTVARTMDAQILHDIARDGSVLLDREIVTREILGAFGGERRERNLSWLEESNAADLSADGKTLLFSETGEGGGLNGSVYLRPTDGGPAIRLGDGQAESLSSDGRWALAIQPSRAGPGVVLLPTGAGEAKTVRVAGLDEVIFAGFVPPDGRSLWVVGSEPGHGVAGYVVDVSGGAARKFAPEVSSGGAQSLDGKLCAYTRADRRAVISPFTGGEARLIAGLDPGDVPIQWTADGRELFVTHWGDVPQPIFRLDLKTGRKEIWKELMPADLTGFLDIGWVVITRDGSSYAYTCTRRTASDLLLVKGWH